MKKIIAINSFLLFICTSLFGQINLIENPSFESYKQISWGGTGGICDSLALNADFWQMCSGSADYFYKFPYNCYYPYYVPLNIYGMKNAYDGSAYYHLMLGSDTSVLDSPACESIQGLLKNPLIINKTYCLEFYISLADSALFATNKVGAYFSDTSFFIIGYDPLPFTPQIENYNPDFYKGKDWHKILGHFTANGGEKFITIGMFEPCNNDNYLMVRPYNEFSSYLAADYYCDMLTLIECDNPIKQANAGNDKIICTGDSTTLGSFNNQYYNYEWQPSTGLSNPKSGTPNASPTVTTTYTLTQKYFDFPVSTDEVTVTVKDCQEPEGLIVYPNPVVDNITFKLLHGLFANGKIEIYDVIGKKILTLLPNDVNIISAEMSIYASGTYLYRAYSEDKMLGTGKFVIQ